MSFSSKLLTNSAPIMAAALHATSGLSVNTYLPTWGFIHLSPEQYEKILSIVAPFAKFRQLSQMSMQQDAISWDVHEKCFKSRRLHK
jgi:hypothetical protein